jgi:hypothetical protein
LIQEFYTLPLSSPYHQDGQLRESGWNKRNPNASTNLMAFPLLQADQGMNDLVISLNVALEI